MPDEPRGERAPRAVVAAFWIVAATFTFWNLWGGSLRDWDEGLSAERAREMIATGNFLTPQLQYVPDFNKPPLYYQLTALALWALGEGEFAVRFWSAVFALLCAGMCWMLADMEGGDWRSGLIAAALLTGSAHWMNQTRQGLLDSGMMLGVVGFAWAATARGTGRANAAIAGVFGAFATLIKGPLWLAVAPGCAWWAWRHEGSAGVRRVALACGVAVALSAPWFGVQVLLHGTDFISRHAAYNYAERITGTIEGHDAGPLMYLATWIRNAPVSALGLLAALACAIKVPALRARLGSPALVGAAVVLAALMISGSRRELYLVWVLPLAAAGAGPVLAEALRSPRAQGVRGYVLALVCLAASLALLRGMNREIKGDRNLKAAALAIRKATPGATVVATWDHPVQVPMFYSHRVAYVLEAGSATGLRAGLADSRRGGVLLAKAKKLADARAVVEGAGMSLGAEIEGTASGDWRVYELKP